MAKSDLECARMASSHEAMGEVLRALQAEWKRRRADQVRAAAEALKDNGGKGEMARDWSAAEHAKCFSAGIMSSLVQKEEVVEWSSGSGGMVASAPVIVRASSEVSTVTAIANEVDVKVGVAKGQAGSEQGKSPGYSCFIRTGRKQEAIQSPSLAPSALASVITPGLGEVLPTVRFMQRVDEIGKWGVDNFGQWPKTTSVDVTERALGCRLIKFRMRYTRELRESWGTVHARKFLPCEKAYFDCMVEAVHRYKSLRTAPSDLFMRQVDEIMKWRVEHMGQSPKRKSIDAIERTLAYRYVTFKMRCRRDLRRSHGIVRGRKFTPDEKMYFDRMEETVHRERELVGVLWRSLLCAEA